MCMSGYLSLYNSVIVTPVRAEHQCEAWLTGWLAGWLVSDYGKYKYH